MDDPAFLTDAEFLVLTTNKEQKDAKGEMEEKNKCAMVKRDQLIECRTLGFDFDRRHRNVIKIDFEWKIKSGTVGLKCWIWFHGSLNILTRPVEAL